MYNGPILKVFVVLYILFFNTFYLYLFIFNLYSMFTHVVRKYSFVFSSTTFYSPLLYTHYLYRVFYPVCSIVVVVLFSSNTGFLLSTGTLYTSVPILFCRVKLLDTYLLKTPFQSPPKKKKYFYEYLMSKKNT